MDVKTTALGSFLLQRDVLLLNFHLVHRWTVIITITAVDPLRRMIFQIQKQ